MAKASVANIDPDTGKPYRMCRKCSDSSPHPMKHCTTYRRPVKPKRGQNTEEDTTSMAPPLRTSETGNSFQDNPGSSDNVTTAPTSEVPTDTTLDDRCLPLSLNNITSASTPVGIPDSLIDPVLRGPCNDNAASPVPHDSSPSLALLTPTSHDNAASNLQRHSSPTETTTPPATPLVPSLRLMEGSSFTPSLTSTPSSHGTFSSPISTPSKSRRKRPTKADPCYGEVVGAYRGNRVLTIRRTRQSTEEKLRAKRLKQGQTDGLDLGVNVPKVFYDRTRSLVTQMHDLAEITGSWIHFSAQHPTASQPFIHYTSKRLRTEGGELLDNLHNANHELYQSLMTARRCDTTQLVAQLARASDKIAEVEAEAETKIAEATAAKEAAEKAATDLRAMLVAAGLPVPIVD
ncbi:hypothetical protein VNI00_018306 [Paramarasmius palmivorus]|uniref:Uncharacterized protein n=1 Tax=Paramarasmius palmivorus TaxID=297713 RepID=A0AAW0B1M6_9AGAR